MKHLPNILTLLRILVTPLLIYLLFQPGWFAQFWATVLFIGAAISDYLDGKLARTMEVGSRLGRFLDPLADKVLVLGTFVALAVLYPRLVPWWGVVLIALRDAGVTGLRSWAESRGRSIKTMYSAKLKTTVQLTFLITTLVMLTAAQFTGLIGRLGQWVVDSPILYVMMLLTVLATVASGVHYAMRMEYVDANV